MQIFQTRHCFAKESHLFLFFIMWYLIYYQKMIAGIKYYPAANSCRRCGEYVRWYCTGLLQRGVKTNMALLTPLGYSPGSISGMLISQSDLCFCSFVLTAFRNHVVLMLPLKEKCSCLESAPSVGMNKPSHLLNFECYRSIMGFCWVSKQGFNILCSLRYTVAGLRRGATSTRRDRHAGNGFVLRVFICVLCTFPPAYHVCFFDHSHF